MGWRMIGHPLSTADMTGIPTVSQRFKTTVEDEENTVLRAVELGVIFYSDPSFTDVYAELWSDRSGSPQKLLATSVLIPSAQCLLVDPHGYKVIGFKFNSPYMLKEGAYYHIALRASGYTGDDTSHIAWRISYPDPQYPAGVTINPVKAAKYPLEMTIISAEIR